MWLQLATSAVLSNQLTLRLSIGSLVFTVDLAPPPLRQVRQLLWILGAARVVSSSGVVQVMQARQHLAEVAASDP